MANPFVHVELATTDVDKAKSFYRSLFDWKLNDLDMGDGMTYTLIEVGEGTGGGMMKHPMPGQPSFWLSYVGVDDVKAATDKARSLGATIIRDVTEVPKYRPVLDLHRPDRRHSCAVARAEEIRPSSSRRRPGPTAQPSRARISGSRPSPG